MQRTIANPTPDMLTPAVQSLVGEILTEANREDSTPLADYIEMIQTSPIVGPAIELKVLLGLNRMGDYSNSNEDYQAFIRQCLEQMRGSLKLSIAELLCVQPLGFACSEWAPIEHNGKWMLDTIQIMDPRKYRFRGKRGQIEDLLYAGDTGDIVVPYDRVIHLTNQRHISFGSPYGVAECKRALAAYKGWKITIAAALIAAKRRGEPITIGFAPGDEQVKIGEDSEGNPVYVPAPQALLNTLQDLENNSVAATSIANRIETIQAAEGTLILDVLKVLQQLQLMAFLVPESILSATGVGDSNLNTGHRNVLDLCVGSVVSQIKERLIEDVIRPLLAWEFGEEIEDFGSFPEPKAQEEGAIDLFNALINAVYNGAFSAADLDVINRMRELAGLPAVTEIAAALDAVPTDPASIDAPTVDDIASQFAKATPKAKGGKGKGKKNCDKGLNCGGSCISAKKKCRKDDPTPSVAAKAKRGKASKSGGGGGGAVASNDADLHPLAKNGAALISDELKELDSLIVPLAEIEKLEKAFNDVFDADPGKAFDSPQWKALNKATSNSDALAVMSKIREKLNQIDRDEAGKIAAKTKILKSAGKVANEADIREQLIDFYQLSGGRGSGSLKKIKFDDDRAYADTDGNLNIGRHGSKTEAKAVFYHEMGHHVEFQSPATQTQLNEWVSRRTNGAKPVPLNSLIKGAKYDDDEIARPDKFIDPYVGKTYSDGATEVLSMGVERFHSPQSMLDFYKTDREHFLLTIGALND